ncbi:hypothetical protein EAL2_c16630 [Peptoclostridium acidaminophilum DSM 3953]|uniref:Uncharacterized protein n=1 Tax=Peptoclostridium acidaminophilum DSM 3953 TaxID=1286171 RepID=W8TGJ5_PEPAC|nr:hypothetical protein [Peptoclostridium acidaminophilum]AHM56958.1 hypothetical protein EAL2_c16630 [Peptoclostridium acidaminophilum DSM 3953]
MFIRLAEFYDWFEAEGYYDINYEAINPKKRNRNVTMIMPITKLYSVYIAEFEIINHKKST